MLNKRADSIKFYYSSNQSSIKFISENKIRWISCPSLLNNIILSISVHIVLLKKLIKANTIIVKHKKEHKYSEKVVEYKWWKKWIIIF
jgi:hypothetical protein